MPTQAGVPDRRLLPLRRSYASSSSRGRVFKEAIEVAGDVAGKAAFDLSAGLAFGLTFRTSRVGYLVDYVGCV